MRFVKSVMGEELNLMNEIERIINLLVDLDKEQGQSSPQPFRDILINRNLSAKAIEQYVIKARKEVMDNVLGECIAFSPKTREIDTPITMKLLKSYEAELKKGLNEKE